MSPAHFNDSAADLRRFQVRLAIAGFVVFAAFCVLFGRFFYLQVVQHDYYQTKAEDNRITVVPLAPNRGIIADRNGVVLARNDAAYTLEISPGRVADLEGTIEGLAAIVDIQQKDRKRFKRLLEESKGADSLPIRTRLNDEEVARFSAQAFRFPGVEIRARLFRQYPQGKMASHALGYIGRINDKDLERMEAEGTLAEYKGSQHMGKVGIEQSYERELHGAPGFAQVEIDAGGRCARSPRRRRRQATTWSSHWMRSCRRSSNGRSATGAARSSRSSPPRAASWRSSRCPPSIPTSSSTASTRRAGRR